MIHNLGKGAITSGKRDTEEFKEAAVKQVVDRRHSVAEVAERFGVSIHSIYAWTKRYGVPEVEPKPRPFNVTKCGD
ncbi:MULTISPECIES: transposase [Janthinobacterium]|uniref:transposase n=1 Tax=Janthinobacterium TaxID=29580 RepID=UPI001C5BBBB3|nr:transposase [Janthinobacterium sp. NKUCC06_STL]MCA1861395.1 transposase [Janthinobacterium lividum]